MASLKCSRYYDAVSTVFTVYLRAFTVFTVVLTTILTYSGNTHEPEFNVFAGTKSMLLRYD